MQYCIFYYESDLTTPLSLLTILTPFFNTRLRPMGCRLSQNILKSKTLKINNKRACNILYIACNILYCMQYITSHAIYYIVYNILYRMQYILYCMQYIILHALLLFIFNVLLFNIF